MHNTRSKEKNTVFDLIMIPKCDYFDVLIDVIRNARQLSQQDGICLLDSRKGNQLLQEAIAKVLEFCCDNECSRIHIDRNVYCYAT